jgi:preprotein translocase subunit SecG
MKKFAIILIALMVISSLTLTLLPTVRSQTVSKEDIKVLSYSWYVSVDGYLMVVGEIQNVGSTTIGPEIVLSGEILTSDGAYASSANRAWVLNLIPQQKAPFIMAFDNPQSSDGIWYAYPSITDALFEAYQPQATSNYNYPDLKITDHSHTIDSDGVYWVSGHVKNTGTQTAKNITLVGTFYNAEGTTVAVGYTEEFLTPSNLEPQATAPFTLRAFDIPQDEIPESKKIENYALLVQVADPVLQGEPVVTQSTLPPSSAPTTESTQTSPTDTDTSQSQTWIYAVVVVIAIVVVLTAVLLVKKRKSPQMQTAKASKTAQRSSKKRKP